MASRKTRSQPRADRRRRIKRQRLISLGLLLLIVLSSPLWTSAVMDLSADQMLSCWSSFRIQTISYHGLSVLNADSLENACVMPYGKSPFEPDYSELIQNIENLPWVASATITRRLPDHLDITVQERTPIAIIRADKIYALSADGVVLPASASDWVWELPMITCRSQTRFTPGTVIDDHETERLLKHVRRVYRSSPRLWANLSELYSVGDQTWTTLLNPPVAVRLDDHVDLRTWKALEQLLRSTRQRIQKGDTVDLRIPGNVIVQTASGGHQLSKEHPDA